MIELIKVQKRSDITPYFSQFQAKSESWLVSDLRTKIEIQERLIQRDTYYVDNSVLRVTDLWKTLFRREFPHKKTVEIGWARTILSHFLKTNVQALNLHQASASTILEMIDFFLPVISHPEGHERFREWLESHESIKERWGEWYVLTRLCFQYLYEEKDIVLPSWYSALLIHHKDTLQTWKRPLWVDLGGQILWSEAELLRQMGQVIDIKVFAVQSEWQKDFDYKLRPYVHLETHAKKITPAPRINKNLNKQVVAHKFSGELAEIRQAVAQTRKWLDEGVEPHEIGILAPDIEKYWPVLKAFLDQEGIPVNKDTNTRLSSWPSVQEWMAYLRIRLKDIRNTDLETHFFRQENPSLNYEEFTSLFANILSSDELGRTEDMLKLYQTPLSLSEKPSRDEWLVFIAKSWNATRDTEPLSRVLESIYLNCPPELQLPLSDWMEQLESLVCRLEVTIEAADREGIHAASLLSAPSLWLRKRIFMGLSEDNLKSSGSQFLSRFEVEKLFSDLGFFLENHELSSKEFELRMLADAETEEDIFTFGVVTLSGQLQAPSAYWLTLKPHGELEAPLGTRWDDIQKLKPIQAFNEVRDLNKSLGERAYQRLLMDLDANQFQNIQINKRPLLSASRIESFLDCPFKFATESVFKLRNLPEVDLHVDPRNYGNFVHDLFEALMDQPSGWEATSVEIENILEKLYIEKYEKYFHPELWPPFKRKLVVTGQRFLRFEKEWRSKFPKTQTIAREKKWSFEVRHADGQLQVRKADEPTDEKAFFISGKIDRVDSDGEGHLVVIDYKSGSTSAENHPQWYERNKLQLLFYIWALEQETSGQEEVVGAFYYLFKTMQRHRGLGIRELGGQLFEVDRSYASLTDKETKTKLLKDLETTLIEIMSRIEGGMFPPRPREEENCKKCNWKIMCRAPHLR